MLSSFFSDKNISVAMIPLAIIPFMTLSGYFVSLDNVPVIMLPFEYISLFKWAFQSLYLVSPLIAE